MKSLRAIIVLILFLYFPVIATNGCLSTSRTAYVEQVTLASAIDKNHHPLNITNTFTMDQEVIYCFVKVGNVKKETRITARWILKEGDMEGKADIELGYFEQTITDPSNIRLQLHQHSGVNFPRGNWEVIVSIDGTEVESTSFTVEKPSAPQLQISSATGYSQTSSEIITKTFSWTYKEQEHILNLDVPKSLYDFYKSKKRVLTSDPQVYSLYVTHPNDDDVFSVLASTLKHYSIENGFTANEFGEFIISFVRSLPYITDLESTGYDEYPKYPLETLFDAKGDCEDSSILLASIFMSSGHYPVLLVSPNHCAVGISGKGNGDRKFYESGGKKYYYVEAIRCNLPVGILPSNFNADDFNVVPLNPIPILSFTFDEFRIGRVFRVSVFINNTGPIASHNIKVISTILSEQDEIVSIQQTNPFTLSVNGEATVTFYLDCPSSGTYRLFVETKWDDIYGYSISKYIDCP